MPLSEKEALGEEGDRGRNAKWICDSCGFENDDNDLVCKNCGASKDGYDQSGDYAGASESDFGGDPLWDDDQGLM
jgi:rubredoxin